jgi:hypothetical protein
VLPVTLIAESARRRSTGRKWLTFYPRNPPIFPLWPAEHVGSSAPDPARVHVALMSARSGHSWTLNVTKDAYHVTCAELSDACLGGPLALNISVVAKSPRIFMCVRLHACAPLSTLPLPQCEQLSLRLRVGYVGRATALIRAGRSVSVRAEFMIEHSRPRMVASTVGHGASVSRSNTRTSSRCARAPTCRPAAPPSVTAECSYYMDRKEGGAVTEAIYRRAARLFRMPQELLYSDRNAESINVLHYLPGQEYRPHYDWGSAGHPESRFATLVMYFNTPLKGGGTARANSGHACDAVVP